jgi:Na+/H+ antiporter NhaC
MIVGSMARPLTDRYKISREKFAFLVDATSAPIAGLAVVSTWIAFEIGLFEQMNQSLALESN